MFSLPGPLSLFSSQATTSRAKEAGFVCASTSSRAHSQTGASPKDPPRPRLLQASLKALISFVVKVVGGLDEDAWVLEDPPQPAKNTSPINSNLEFLAHMREQDSRA